MNGFQICALTRRVDSLIVEAFRALPVANVSDCMSRMTAGGASLRPYHAKGVLAGPAFTVKTRPGDNLMIHKALHMAKPGDVIVVDAGGDVTNALIGELMVATAVKNGIAGFVMNGAIRDVDAIGAGTFPVYAAGVTHRGPYKDGPGSINVSVSLNGMVINPGDLILGDADGLLCVPIDEAQALLEATRRKQDAEKVTIREIEEGTLDTKWIDATLTRLGVEVPA
ncbi:RraA family protein [Diaphorobacter ruginosibacter]|uniref:Putative 4-hydroxy-4-methyl-2-oxoglutarate aldolase n=1 Tax=Diaphorobacter ruginosibacter TaxID=1715720 RepID=A0A7G9RVE2_9BURK|nr:RraA family protein [Diaphorobacter ruginosibacter]MDR2335486.1 RraA family protein [Burkholderiaceae bacterium]QNN59567.1 RraA family protein [Diaphorobacter ruginosibacter]HWV63740.1 RraA family protein [Oxalicibacterium sp.]